MTEITAEQYRQLIEELNIPVDTLETAAVLLCLATSLGSNGCHNCPVSLCDYDSRTVYQKQCLHEPCQSNLLRWLRDKANGISKAMDIELSSNDAEKWAEWKQLDKEGRLVVLPCAIGTRVYRVISDKSVDWPDPPRYIITPRAFSLNDISSFGTTVFISKEEAELKAAALSVC